MTSLKKLRKSDRDEWRGLLVIVKQSEYAQIKAAADMDGLTPNQWARKRLCEVMP